jgi:hypothetical protein
MNWKKGCSLAAAALLVLVALVLAVVFYATSGAVGSADEFLETIAAGDVAAAYEQTAPAFQTQTDEAAFAAVVERLGLADYASRSWSSRSVAGGQAELEGTFTTRAGDEIPLEMVLVKVAGEWRVFSLSGRQAGAALQGPGEPEPVPAAATVPAPEELAALATGSVLALNRSIVERDFATFYAGLSRLWQAQTTPDELAEAFRAFVDNEIDFAAVGGLEPVFEGEPAIDSDGVLELAGYFPTTPVRVVFRLRYVLESGGWELLGIQVDLKE